MNKPKSLKDAAQRSLDAMTKGNIFTHVDEKGKANMVDISEKKKIKRTASASTKINLQKSTIELIKQNEIAKGDVLATANIAGIMAGKKCSELIPLCHNIEIDYIRIEFEIRENHILIKSEAACTDKTGIEMEVLTACSVAALTIYDMCKAIDKTMLISDLKLDNKTKG